MITKGIKNILFSLCVVGALVACSNDDADHRPGLWTSQEVIETFPGDTVLVQGQVSNYIGMRSVTIVCADWGINKTYELEGKHAKVFNYNYRMPVPSDAVFNSELKITVTDTEGTENKKTVVLKYLPDTTAPSVVQDIWSDISVDFDENAGQGFYTFKATVSDDRRLKSIRLQIPSLKYDKTTELSGRSADYAETLTFTEMGRFPMTVTISDESGNETVATPTFVVMPAEVEYPFSDYPVMWVVNASEKADDYLDGYYSPMQRTDAYQYNGKFYADKDGYQLYFTSEKRMDGDLFGCSPIVSSKLMNNNGYVVPVTIDKKGYYGIWIDINQHIYSIWNLDTSAAYTGSLTLSGTGFNDFGDWGWTESEMQRDGFRYTQTVSQNGAYTDTRQYYAARISDWAYVLRYWATAEGCGWWEDTEGSGGSIGSYVSNYDGNVEITFDTALLWATVKKK